MRSFPSNIIVNMWFSLLLLVSACSPDVAAPPSADSMVQQLNLVDKNGRYYGVMDMTPLGGAKIYDNKGRMMGEVAALQ